MNRLYIIGNGFDLYHGLPTSYKCFNCFVHRMFLEEHERIGRIFNRMDPNLLWSSYEEMLPKLDIAILVKDNMETWLNCNNKYDVENAFDTLYDDLMRLFHEWVLQIDYSMANENRLALDNEAAFLNFNYTNTLERLYGVCRKQICYIHGDTGNNSLYKPVIGHGESSVESAIFPHIVDICKIVNSYNKFPQWAQNSCEFMQVILEIIKSFLYYMKKNTDYYIQENNDWFSRLCNKEDIYVLGHSLADVDAPYFKRVYNETPNATWHVSCYDEKEKKNNKQKLCDLLAVSQKNINIELFELDELELKKEN